ncbi:hypothetical protein GJ496_005618 [Pomphorhynchus laevis]|nr:hypothetical protein GJ496_005618 [Pomphorhynchus laevis]
MNFIILNEFRPKEGIVTNAYAAFDPTNDLVATKINRRHLLENDVQIEILFCGICHTDIHIAKNEWNSASYPVVPGHEITGIVTSIGSKVTKFSIGNKCGVGFYVDTCGTCTQCKDRELEQYCENGIVIAFNSEDKRNENGCLTCGGYSQCIVVNEKYVFKWPESLPMDAGAPLLCAGITVYSPLKYLLKKQIEPYRVGIIGIGGLGHIAIAMAKAMGSDVTAIGRTNDKKQLALDLGADRYITQDELTKLNGGMQPLDTIIDTISVDHDLNQYLKFLKLDGTLVPIGLPGGPMRFNARQIIINRRKIMGSVVGSLKETQSMLDFCAEKNITCLIEKIDISNINEAYQRTIKGDVKFRFVIDIKASKWN